MNRFGQWQPEHTHPVSTGIRAYATSANTSDAVVGTNVAAGSYDLPFGKTDGFLTIGAGRLATPEGTFNILSHELGHFKVEEPGAVLANARANALTANSSAGV
jgi:hypothetical protein